MTDDERKATAAARIEQAVALMCLRGCAGDPNTPFVREPATQGRIALARFPQTSAEECEAISRVLLNIASGGKGVFDPECAAYVDAARRFWRSLGPS